jgi:hypothetical protein
MQPGDTITPGATPAPVPEPEKQVPTPAPVEQTPPPAPDPIPPAETPETSWQYNESTEEALGNVQQPQITPVSWTASEYIAHNKGMPWFAALGLVLFLVVAGTYLITKDIVTSAVLAVAGIAFGVFAARPPRVLEYTVDSHGIKIDQKYYPYKELRSFDIVDEGQLPSILLMPLKRFLPPITVFYDLKEEDAILNVLGSYLPHQEQQPDMVDRLMRRIRF